MRFQTWLAWAMLFALVVALPILNHIDTSFLGGLAFALAYGGGLSVVQEFGIARILTDAPRTRAPRPREPVHRVSPMPRALYWLLMSAYLVLSVLGILAIILEILDGRLPPPALLFGASTTLAFAIVTWLLRRRMFF